MTPDELVERWRAWPDAEALVWRERTLSYSELASEVASQRTALRDRGIKPGTIVALDADFGPTAIGLLFALWLERAIVLLEPKARIGEWRFTIASDGSVVASQRQDDTRSDLLDRLRAAGAPGLLLRTSGSAGTPKTIVHDVERLLRNYEALRPGRRTVAILLFDHMGGLSTMLTTLSRGGCLVIPESRTPEVIAETVARHAVEILPASPTFLNLLVLSDAHRRHDFRSLRFVAYGTEVMPDSTLQRLRAAWPYAKIVQDYGLSETTTLPTRTRASDSQWIMIGGPGVEWRVVDGLIEIRSDRAMLGYLDAPSPFTPDGWLRTGDAVDVDGEFVRVRGRQSDLINVGGQKVYPGEVESVLLAAPGVLEATVSAEASPLIGSMVKAVVRVAGDEPNEIARARLRQFAQERLLPYQVPQRLVITREPLHTERLKARRRDDA